MDNKMKMIIFTSTVLVVLIILKLTVFTSVVGSELIPGVTNESYLIRIETNSTLGDYILSDEFSLRVSGIAINSKSEIYGTNETDGRSLYNDCKNAFISNSYDMEEDDIYEKEGRYTGIYKNESRRIIFHIVDNENVYEYTGYHVLLIVNRGRM